MLLYNLLCNMYWKNHREILLKKKKDHTFCIWYLRLFKVLFLDNLTIFKSSLPHCPNLRNTNKRLLDANGACYEA